MALGVAPSGQRVSENSLKARKQIGKSLCRASLAGRRGEKWSENDNKNYEKRTPLSNCYNLGQIRRLSDAIRRPQRPKAKAIYKGETLWSGEETKGAGRDRERECRRGRRRAGN